LVFNPLTPVVGILQL